MNKSHKAIFAFIAVLTSSSAIAQSLVDLGTQVKGQLPAVNIVTGTSGANIPLLNGANTWSAQQTIGGTGTATGLLTVTAQLANQTAIAGNAYSTSQPIANYTLVPFQYNAIEDFGSFGDANSHFGFVVNGGKAVSTANTTGSWNLFRAGYTGYGGSTTASFITAAQMIVQPTATAGGFNNLGNFTGANPVCLTPTGMTPTSCVGMESDVQTATVIANIREGIRISDIGSAASAFGTNSDAALGIAKATTAIGFKNGILVGDPAVGQNSFPVAAGGAVIQTSGTTNALQSFIDFSNITGVPTSAAITLPQNIREACFGTVGNCTGGAILSSTTANGGQLVFNNNTISFNWAGNIFNVDNLGNVNASGTMVPTAGIRLPKVAFASLPACNAGNEGLTYGVTDSNTVVYNASLAGGGTNHIIAYCNGTAWTAH